MRQAFQLRAAQGEGEIAFAKAAKASAIAVTGDFAEIAGADAGRIEALHLRQYRGDFVVAGVDVGTQGIGDRIQQVARIAVVVDGVTPTRIRPIAQARASNGLRCSCQATGLS